MSAVEQWLPNDWVLRITMSFKQMGVEVTLEGLSFMESTCEVSYDGRLFQMVAEKWLNARLSLTRQFAKMTSWAWWFFFNIDNWQGSLATCLRAVEYLNTILLQIYHWVCQRKNFENRLTFGEVMGMSLVSCFFDLQCSVRAQTNRFKNSFIPYALADYR